MAEKSQIVCRSLIGIEYTGPDVFDPRSAPGVMAGAVLGAVAALAVWARIGAGQAAGGS